VKRERGTNKKRGGRGGINIELNPPFLKFYITPNTIVEGLTKRGYVVCGHVNHNNNLCCIN
jgi:hypothetical protein